MIGQWSVRFVCLKSCHDNSSPKLWESEVVRVRSWKSPKLEESEVGRARSWKSPKLWESEVGRVHSSCYYMVILSFEAYTLWLLTTVMTSLSTLPSISVFYLPVNIPGVVFRNDMLWILPNTSVTNLYVMEIYRIENSGVTKYRTLLLCIWS